MFVHDGFLYLIVTKHKLTVHFGSFLYEMKDRQQKGRKVSIQAALQRIVGIRGFLY